MFSCKNCKIFMNSSFLHKTYGGCFWKTWEDSIHARFNKGLLQLLFTFFDWKTSKWAYHLKQFFISYWGKFLKLTKFIAQSYLLLLNLFLSLSTFSVFLYDYFFKWLAYKFLLSRFSVLTNYIMWSYNLFSVSDFSGSKFFRA